MSHPARHLAALAVCCLLATAGGFAAAQEVVAPESMTAPVGDLAAPPVFYPDVETTLGMGWPTDPCRDYCGDSRWFVLVEALWLKHDGDPTNSPVFVDSRLQSPQLSTDEFELDSAVAPRVTLGYKITEFSMLEAVFNGEHRWNDTQSFIDLNRVALPMPLGRQSNDFDEADAGDLTYVSQFNNAEFNFYRSLGDYCGKVPWLAVMFGVRYVGLDEDFTASALNINVGRSEYAVSTENDLFGGQFGLRVQHVSGSFRFEINGKAGMFDNDASQSTLLTDDGGATVLRDFSVDGDRTAFIGELNFAVSWQLTSCLGIRTGYTAIWLEDVLVAPDQLDFTNSLNSGANVVGDGHLILHGASVGLYVRW